MPINKNAFVRYKYLDRLLSDHHHYYDIHDLTDKVNEMLYNDGFPEVTQRCIEKDLKTLEYAPFSAPLERFKKNGKSCITYGKYSFSIFNTEMSSEERSLLREVLSTLGQFGGISNFKWLDDFKIGLGLEERRQIICFSNNPYLQNTNLLGVLFDYISNEVVINLSYHTFSDVTVRCIEFHPYILKQYNDRWFLIGAAYNDGKILTFALDRIDKVEPIPEKKYAKCPEELYERFEDIVGVTFYEDKIIEHIVFWVNDMSKDYVETKPIHESQIIYHGEDELLLHNEYPYLNGGAFFSIDCISNYELIRELCSFGHDLIVLSPDSIKSAVYTRFSEALKNYKEIFNTKVK